MKGFWLSSYPVKKNVHLQKIPHIIDEFTISHFLMIVFSF